MPQSDPKTRERRPVAPDVRSAIRALARHRHVPGGPYLFDAAAIQRMLEEVPTLSGPVPPLRTVQYHVQAERSGNTGDPEDDLPWRTVETAEPGDVPLVLEVVGELIRASRGRWRSVSRREARAILRVRHAAPDLPPWESYLLALAYTHPGDFDAEAIDGFLALRPWASLDAWQQYQRVVNRDLGYVVVVPRAGSPAQEAEGGALAPAPDSLIEWAAMSALATRPERPPAPRKRADKQPDAPATGAPVRTVNLHKASREKGQNS